MPRFLIESPHTKQECLRALDETLERGPNVLAQYEYGCGAGVHTGWATVEARNEAEARMIIPDFLQSKSRVVRLTRYTPEQVRSFHE